MDPEKFMDNFWNALAGQAARGHLDDVPEYVFWQTGKWTEHGLAYLREANGFNFNRRELLWAKSLLLDMVDQKRKFRWGQLHYNRERDAIYLEVFPANLDERGFLPDDL